MSNVLIRPELGRAFQKYFGIRGGSHPGVMQEICPVVVMDDTSQGPFPSYRSWFAGNVDAAAPVNFRYYCIMNLDPPEVNSVVVVDEVIGHNNGAVPGMIDVWIGIQDLANLPAVSTGIVADAMEEKEKTQFQPVIGNVGFGALDSALAVGQARVDLSMARGCPLGPFAIHPGAVFYVRNVLPATKGACFFRGRYYSPT